MDNYRRRPPMEGFSRPGQLGGEAFDNDEVEGHIMDERDEIQGESIVRRRVDDDTEGHLTRTSRGLADDDDTEGHKLTTRGVADEDDTEGHKLTTRGVADEDDTEGHTLTKRS
jgi:hypothetical protein